MPHLGNLQHSPRPSSWISGVQLLRERKGKIKDKKKEERGGEKKRGTKGKKEKKGKKRKLPYQHLFFPLISDHTIHEDLFIFNLTCC